MENIDNLRTDEELLAEHNIQPCRVVVKKLSTRHINHCTRSLPQKKFTIFYSDGHLADVINSAHKNLNIHQKPRKGQKEQKVNLKKLFNSSKAAKSHTLDFKKFKAAVSVSTVAHKVDLKESEEKSKKPMQEEKKRMVVCNTLKSALSLSENEFVLVDTKDEKLCKEALKNKMQIKIKDMCPKNFCSKDPGRSYMGCKDEGRSPDEESHFPDGFPKEDKFSVQQHDLKFGIKYPETSASCPGSSKNDTESLEVCQVSTETAQKSADLELEGSSPPSPVVTSESPPPQFRTRNMEHS